MKISFPDSEKYPEAVARIDGMITKYGELIDAAHVDFRDAEADLASRLFRFPDRVAKLLKTASASLSEFGRLVNEGLFDKADFQYARFKDDYSQISREGRGWRLADPFEGVRKNFRLKPQEDAERNKYELTKSEMDAILELVQKRGTTQLQNSFAIHPPKKLLDQPEIATSEKVIDELDNSIFVVSFQDGTSRMMSLVELMVFTYDLLVLKQQWMEVAKMMDAVSLRQRTNRTIATCGWKSRK